MSAIAFQQETECPVVVEPPCRVVLGGRYDGLAQQAIRALIARLRGELSGVTAANRLHLHLGRRRLDDVVAGLEAAGYGVDAIVLPRPEPPKEVFAG